MKRLLTLGILFFSLNSCAFGNTISCYSPYNIENVPVAQLLSILKDNNSYKLEIDNKIYEFRGKFFLNSGGFFPDKPKFTTNSIMPKDYDGKLWFVYKKVDNYKYIKFDISKNNNSENKIQYKDLCFNEIPDFAGLEIYNDKSRYFVGFSFSYEEAY